MTTAIHDAQQKLLSRRAALTRLHARNRAEEDELASEPEPDWPDRAQLASEAELVHGLTEHERNELLEIDAALRRIEAGRFGDCEECGGPIGLQRLSAIPETRLCFRCSASRSRA